ncbi:MAG: LysR family transcriptional regulator [Halioglobus sp.]|nr:LysR family transcriptional regulator [Halioglobus sp.]
MDIQQLRAFLLVAESGSFSAAAQTLHLTQPAVSKRIAQLEDTLQAALFDRIGRRVRTTESGDALLPHARAVQREIQAAEQSVRDLAGEVGGRLRLATSHHIGLHRLPPVLSHYSSAYPAVHLDIDFMDSERAYERTLRGEVELAVVTLSPEHVANSVTHLVWHDPLDFMAQAGHALTQCKTVTLDVLSEHPAILPGLNTYTGQIVKRLFDERGLPVEVAIATNYLETIRMMASVGLGWTVLPRSMREDSLVTLPLDDATIERSLGVVQHEGHSLSRAARAFIDALKTFGDAPAAASAPS